MALRLLTFDSVHQALKAERALRVAEFNVTAVNVPRRLSSDCGIALEFEVTEEEKIITVLQSNGVDYRGIHDE